MNNTLKKIGDKLLQAIAWSEAHSVQTVMVTITLIIIIIFLIDILR